MTRYLKDDHGGQDPKIHRFVWPLKPWKGRRLVSLPLEYLRRFIKQKPNKGQQRLFEMANAEVSRRGFTDDHIHLTEHCLERFTQRWSDLIVKYQEHMGKKPLGAVSIMKHQFKKALKLGVTSKAEGNNGNNFKLAYGKFIWLYGTYKNGNKQEMKVISVMPGKS